VYLGTHCNIGSKGCADFLTGVLCRWHNCLVIYRRKVALCHAHIALFTFASWLSKTSDSSDRRNLSFPWAYSAQTLHPPPKLTHQMHVFGMSTRPRNDSNCPKLYPCTVWDVPLSQTPPRKYPFSVFWRPVKPLRRHSETFQRFTHAHTDSRLLYQKCSKSVHDKWPKVRVVLVTEKTISPNFVWVQTVTPHLYARFHPDPFGFGEI